MQQRKAVLPAYLYPQSIEDIEKLAEIFAGRDPEKRRQTANKIIRGAELGFSAAYSNDNIHFMQEKTSLSAKAYGRLVKRRAPEYDYEVVERSNERSIIRFLKNGEVLGVHTFSIEKAKKVGLTTRKMWQQFPDNMCFARCMTEGVTIYMPEIEASGFYIDDELYEDHDTTSEIARAANDPDQATIATDETPEQIAAAETATASKAKPAPAAPATISPAQATAFTQMMQPLDIGKRRTLLEQFAISRVSLLPLDKLDAFTAVVQSAIAGDTPPSPQTTQADLQANHEASHEPADRADTTGEALVGEVKAREIATRLKEAGASTADIRALLLQYHVERISLLPVRHYRAFVAQAKGLIETAKGPTTDTTSSTEKLTSVKHLAEEFGLPAEQVLNYLRAEFKTTNPAALDEKALGDLCTGLAGLKPATAQALGATGTVPMHLQ